MPDPDFAARLKALRLRAGLSVRDLAAAAGLNRTHVYKLEAGQREPTWAVVRQIAAALGARTDDFLPPPGA